MSDQKKSVVLFEKFLVSLTLCLGGGWLAGWLTQHGLKNWYPYLIKSRGTPPDLVFPIVWTILYILMAVSLTLLWAAKTHRKKMAFLFFGIQLFFNFIWSWLFFYLQRPEWALIDIVLLWVFIFFTILSFKKHTLWGSFLFLPYLAWVSYAFYLNLFIFLHN